VTNRIVGALQHGATKLGKALGEDAANAVKDLYHSTGHNLTGVAEDTAAADAKHAKALRDLRRDREETPVYHMADDGSITRLRHDPTAENPEDRYKRDPLTQEDEERLGLDSANLGRPRRGERNAMLRNKKEGRTDPRPRASSREVPLGSTDLARATQLGRHADNSYGPLKPPEDEPFSSNNYAAARVRGANGHEDFILVGRSNGYRHSERMIGPPFLREGNPSRIRELYTERQPCVDPPKCSSWMAERFPDARVSHSVEYGDADSRARGNEVMRDYLDQLRSSR
jgi:hypothetical protein